jgi:hypothetical protein
LHRPNTLPAPEQALFPITLTALTFKVPLLLMPPPTDKELAWPCLIVSFDRVTLALELEIMTTVLMPPPSIIVVLAPEPMIVKLLPIVRFSVYVAEPARIESPEAASEMACLMVLQAVVGDVQLLLLLPVTPLTYQVLATTGRTRAVSSKAVSSL